MGKRALSRKTENAQAVSAPPGALRKRSWKRFLRGPDQEILDELYLPGLSEALYYDRCCSYFSSSVLSAAARGFGKLIERILSRGECPAKRPHVRLVVNEELAADDVRALIETGDFRRLEALLLKRLTRPRELLERRRLDMLAWMAGKGFLDIRVGVMRVGGGIVHAKFGIMTDEAQDAVVFSGSGNESAPGIAGNYERLEVSTSWEDAERRREYEEEFDDLWTNRHAHVHTVPLPEAVRLKLIKWAPKEPPVEEPSGALERRKAAMLLRFLVEAPYLPDPLGGLACDATTLVDLWPHQKRVVEDVANAWPEGRLLCDEVGMGKTIEAIGALRRLLAGRGVRRALLLVPAGLLRQWQAELREKGGLIVPRLEGLDTLVWPDDEERNAGSLPEALREDVLLLSRETARTETNMPSLLEAEPWDLVLLDEAHAARRKKQEEGEFNSATLLLGLLRGLQLRGRAKGFLFLSATPMQTHPWEPWDLLSVLGEGGAWLADFSPVRAFYGAAAKVESGRCGIDSARKAAALILRDSQFPGTFHGQAMPHEMESLAQRLAFPMPSESESLARWLREGSPLARRMRRNTRETLRQYCDMGLLDSPPPRREVQDILYDYRDPNEQKIYDAIQDYIERRFEELEREKPGKGFVMTIYRRRATSSPLALQRSLRRRRQGLERVIRQQAIQWDLEREDEPEALDPEDLPEEESGFVSSAFPSNPKTAQAELQEVEDLLRRIDDLHGRDSKRDMFFDVLRRLTEDGRAALVFTGYTDTLEYLREWLVSHYGKALGCYSGAGGRAWDGASWQPVAKDDIAKLLQRGNLRVLLCTDAASEGLNLQAAGALINYDLPWTPSKVEQRIGRIDRIGQRLSTVRIANLFLRNTVDEQVYRTLRERCGLFVHFVGAMQPVLSRAKRMLMGQERFDLGALRQAAAEAEQDSVAKGAYIQSAASTDLERTPPIKRSDFLTALSFLDGNTGVSAKRRRKARDLFQVKTGNQTARLSASLAELEHDKSVAPLTPSSPHLRALAERLLKQGERLPLVIASHADGAFRRSIAYWVEEGGVVEIESFERLLERVRNWKGKCPAPADWVRVESLARAEAAEQTLAARISAEGRSRSALEQQASAARLRLLREVGRFLLCMGEGNTDLNGVFHSGITRDAHSAKRLRECHERLGGYPDWKEALVEELAEEYQGLPQNRRKARLLGSEVDAALQDPRWTTVLAWAEPRL